MATIGAATWAGSFSQAVERMAADVDQGLSMRPKRLPARWFYDSRGSQLFQRITELDEYYLTRCEREILLRHCHDLTRLLARRPVRLIEFGAGDGAKTEILLDCFLSDGLRVEYVPIDICVSILDELRVRMRSRFPTSSLSIAPLAAEYADGLAALPEDDHMRNLAIFLGSSIGNMHEWEAVGFLRSVRAGLNPGDYLLIGFDLKKDPAVLQRAYDDSQGITREFNLNLLDRLNRELGADFAREKFLHHCQCNVERGRMESWLLSVETQDVGIEALGQRFHFDAWEGIHVECSYKYDVAQTDMMARASGFRPVRHYHDARRYFLDSLWQVPATP